MRSYPLGKFVVFGFTVIHFQVHLGAWLSSKIAESTNGCFLESDMQCMGVRHAWETHMHGREREAGINSGVVLIHIPSLRGCGSSPHRIVLLCHALSVLVLYIIVASASK